jgi:hypothetical protein
LRKLKKRAADTQATLDTILLKAAQTEDNLAEEFLRLARQRQKELALLNQRIDQTEAGKQENGRNAAKIIELAQHLAEQYVTFPPPQRRQIVDSVFSNLQLEDVNLCGNYRLPFSILSENSSRPLKSGRLDLNQRPLDPQSSALPNCATPRSRIYSTAKPSESKHLFYDRQTQCSLWLILLRANSWLNFVCALMSSWLGHNVARFQKLFRFSG